MTQEKLKAMVDVEAQPLGIGRSAFMERHREIMELADQIQQQYENLSHLPVFPFLHTGQSHPTRPIFIVTNSACVW